MKSFVQEEEGGGARNGRKLNSWRKYRWNEPTNNPVCARVPPPWCSLSLSLSSYNRVSSARSLPDLLGPAASKKTCNAGELSALGVRSLFPVACIVARLPTPSPTPSPKNAEFPRAAFVRVPRPRSSLNAD